MNFKAFLAGLFLAPALLMAAPIQREAAINSIISQTCVSTSTSTWTAIPATGGARTGVFISNPGPSTQYIGFDSSKATTVPAIIVISSGTIAFSVAGSVSLYGHTNDTAASSVCITEYGQQ